MNFENLKITVDLKNNPEIQKVAEDILQNDVSTESVLDHDASDNSEVRQSLTEKDEKTTVITEMVSESTTKTDIVELPLSSTEIENTNDNSKSEQDTEPISEVKVTIDNLVTETRPKIDKSQSVKTTEPTSSEIKNIIDNSIEPSLSPTESITKIINDNFQPVEKPQNPPEPNDSLQIVKHIFGNETFNYKKEIQIETHTEVENTIDNSSKLDLKTDSGLSQEVRIRKVPEKFCDIPAGDSSDPILGKNLGLSFDTFTAVSVVQVEDTDHIFIRPLEWEDEFEKMSNAILACCKDQQPSQNVANGMILGTSEDSLRVKIIKAGGHMIQVEYIDIGAKGFVKENKLFDIPEEIGDLKILPRLCAEVALAGIKMSQNQSKKAKAIAMLSQIISKTCFVKQVKSSDNNVTRVIMAETDDGSNDLGKRLLDKGLVEKNYKPKNVDKKDYNTQFDDFLEVTMVDIIDPDHFYLKRPHVHEPNFGENYQFFQSSRFQPQLKSIAMLEYKGTFQRVMVVDIKEFGEVTVQFMDIGGRLTLPSSHLGCIEMGSPLFQHPPSAILAKMSGISPLKGDTWDQNAVDNFNLVLGILEDDPVPLYAARRKEQGFWDDPNEVQLSTEPDGSINLADVMIEMGFAKKWTFQNTSVDFKNTYNQNHARCRLRDLYTAPFPRPGDQVVFSDCDNDQMNLVHMHYRRDESLLGELQAALTNQLKTGALENIQHLPQPEELVIARWTQDRNIYRAVVESTSTSEMGAVKVKFIDFGGTEWVALKDMFHLPEPAKDYRVLSHTVELADVLPVSMVSPEQGQEIRAIFNRFNMFNYVQVQEGRAYFSSSGQKLKNMVPRVYIQSVPQDVNGSVNINRKISDKIRIKNQSNKMREINQISCRRDRYQSSGSLNQRILPLSFKSNKRFKSEQECPIWISTITHLDPNDNGIFNFILLEDLDVIEKMFDNFPSQCIPNNEFQPSQGTMCLWRDPDSDLVYRVAVVEEPLDGGMPVKKIDFGDIVEQANCTDLFQLPEKMKLAWGAPLVRTAILKRFNVFDSDFDEFDNNDKKALLRELQLWEGEIDLKILDHDGNKYNSAVKLLSAEGNSTIKWHIVEIML